MNQRASKSYSFLVLLFVCLRTILSERIGSNLTVNVSSVSRASTFSPVSLKVTQKAEAANSSEVAATFLARDYEYYEYEETTTSTTTTPSTITKRLRRRLRRKLTTESSTANVELDSATVSGELLEFDMRWVLF